MMRTLNSYLTFIIYMLVFDPIYRMKEQVGYFEAGHS